MNGHRHAAGAQGVVLRLGSDAGAVVLTTAPARAGAEVHLIAEDGGDRHAEVHARVDGLGRTLHAVVFDDVEPGSYRVRGLGCEHTIVVRAAEVATATMG